MEPAKRHITLVHLINRRLVNAEINTIMTTSDVQKRMADMGEGKDHIFHPYQER